MPEGMPNNLKGTQILTAEKLERRLKQDHGGPDRSSWIGFAPCKITRIFSDCFFDLFIKKNILLQLGCVH
jgi:hypothetical protein